jgi:hypothetical protein
VTLLECAPQAPLPLGPENPSATTASVIEAASFPANPLAPLAEITAPVVQVLTTAVPLLDLV